MKSMVINRDKNKNGRHNYSYTTDDKKIIEGEAISYSLSRESISITYEEPEHKDDNTLTFREFKFDEYDVSFLHNGMIIPAYKRLYELGILHPFVVDIPEEEKEQVRRDIMEQLKNNPNQIPTIHKPGDEQ